MSANPIYSESPLWNLPEDLQVEVIRHLPQGSLACLAQTSKQGKKITDFIRQSIFKICETISLLAKVALAAGTGKGQRQYRENLAKIRELLCKKETKITINLIEATTQKAVAAFLEEGITGTEVTPKYFSIPFGRKAFFESINKILFSKYQLTADETLDLTSDATYSVELDTFMTQNIRFAALGHNPLSVISNIENGSIDCDTRLGAYRTLLHYAIDAKCKALFDALLLAGANIEAQFSLYDIPNMLTETPPLFHACNFHASTHNHQSFVPYDYLPMIKSLLEQGARVDAPIQLQNLERNEDGTRSGTPMTLIEGFRLYNSRNHYVPERAQAVLKLLEEAQN